MSLPLDWLDLVQPLPGQFFVVRHEQAGVSPSGRIILSPNFTRGIRKATGTVYRTNRLDIPEGATVLLSPGVSRRMTFGERDEAVTLYVCLGLGSVQYIWPPATEAPAVFSGGSTQGRWGADGNLAYDENRADEGLPLQPSAESD